MDVRAWCGHCGESFRLAEIVDSGVDGRCPRCGEPLAPDYTPVLSSTVHELLTASAALHSAATRLHEVAPRLHVEAKRLADDLSEALGER